jgi:hypothetical protein
MRTPNAVHRREHYALMGITRPGAFSGTYLSGWQLLLRYLYRTRFDEIFCTVSEEA